MPYSIALGGTGSVTAAGARVNLGIQQLIDDINIDVSQLQSDISSINGQISSIEADILSLDGRVTVNEGVISSLAPIATSGSASDLTTGTLPPLRIVSSNGLIARTSTSSWAARTITAGTNISITNGDGVAGNPVINVSGIEEAGTWTPRLEGMTTAGTPTYNAQNGVYRRVGSLIFASIHLVVTALGGATGTLTVANLPFNRLTGNERRVAMVFPFWSGLDISPGSNLVGFFQDTGNTVRLLKHSSVSGISPLTDSDVTGSITLYGTIVYEGSI